MHKCQYGGKGLDKNEQGIIQPIPNEGQQKRTTNIGLDESTPSSSSLTTIIQHIDTNDQIYTRYIFDEWMHCRMMHGPMEELQDYYIDLFLPPIALV